MTIGGRTRRWGRGYRLLQKQRALARVAPLRRIDARLVATAGGDDVPLVLVRGAENPPGIGVGRVDLRRALASGDRLFDLPLLERGERGGLVFVSRRRSERVRRRNDCFLYDRGGDRR